MSAAWVRHGQNVVGGKECRSRVTRIYSPYSQNRECVCVKTVYEFDLERCVVSSSKIVLSANSMYAMLISVKICRLQSMLVLKIA